jgi:hypothetical protein
MDYMNLISSTNVKSLINFIERVESLASFDVCIKILGLLGSVYKLSIIIKQLQFRLLYVKYLGNYSQDYDLYRLSKHKVLLLPVHISQMYSATGSIK